MSFDWVAAQRAMQNWVENGSGLPDAKVYWGDQDSARPAGPAIMLRISSIGEIGPPAYEMEDNLFAFADKTITAVDTVANTFTIPAHGLETGVGPVQIDSSTDDPPAPLLENKDYWVIVTDPDHVQIAGTFEATGGGDVGNPVTPIDIQGIGSGTLTLKSTSKTTYKVGGLSVSRAYVRVTLELRCHAAEATGNNMAVALLQRIRLRRDLDTQHDILKQANIALIDCERIRAVPGIKDALLFEPKAFMDVSFAFAMEESEAIQIISSVEITDLRGPTTFTVP